jgi:hypothetical protein
VTHARCSLCKYPVGDKHAANAVLRQEHVFCVDPAACHKRCKAASARANAHRANIEVKLAQTALWRASVAANTAEAECRAAERSARTRQVQADEDAVRERHATKYRISKAREAELASWDRQRRVLVRSGVCPQCGLAHRIPFPTYCEECRTALPRGETP